MQKYVDGQLVEMTEQEVAAFEAERTPSLAAAKSSAIERAWALCASKIASDDVIVSTSAGDHSFGLDERSQSNIKSVLLGVLLGVTANPRPWTPRGASSPISVTHDDLKAIGTYMMAAVDARMQTYLSHKSAILGLATVEAVLAYDITAGWPE